MKQPHTLSVWPLSLKNRELQRIRRPLRKGNGTIEVQPATVAQSWSQLSSRLQPKSAYKNHVQIQPVQEIVLSTIDLAKQRKKLRVAVFAQAANLTMLPELQRCITNVGAAQAKTRSILDVYLSTPLARPSGVPHIAETVRLATPALGMLKVGITLNKGADMGQLLQQMQSAAGQEYDAVLKIHTKSNNHHRRLLLDRLCGSTDAAQKIIASFASNPALGLASAEEYVGWKGLPAGSPSFEGHLWSKSEQENMKRTWQLISPGEPMPPEDAWASAVCDFWWSRGSSVTSNPVLLAAAPRLLAHMNWGYTQGSAGQPEHALERLIGTMVRAEGGVVARLRP